MAHDHFRTHYWQAGRTDWNFNILFADQPQVAELARAYAPLLDDPGLYPPVPPEWLHCTVLRVGFLEDYTEDEMAAVLEKLRPQLAELRMPELRLGQWWLWGGNPCLHLAPDTQLDEIAALLAKALAEVVGEARAARHLFIPHVTLAYSREHEDNLDLYNRLATHPIPAVPARAECLSLVKQRVEDHCYVWQTVREAPIGQASNSWRSSTDH